MAITDVERMLCVQPLPLQALKMDQRPTTMPKMEVEKVQLCMHKCVLFPQALNLIAEGIEQLTFEIECQNRRLLRANG